MDFTHSYAYFLHATTLAISRLVWTILLDQGAILYFTQMWEGAQAALVLTTFEAALSGQPYLAVPSALMALMLGRDLGFVFCSF